MIKILIVDDDTELRERLSRILFKEGYQTTEATSGKDAVKKAEAESFDIILIDMIMPGKSGIDSILDLKSICRKTKIIMITAFATVRTAVDAVKKGASEYLSKPFKIEELLVIIKRVLEETRFEENIKDSDLNTILSSLSNPIRRDVIKLLYAKTNMRFNEIVKGVHIEDHTKLVFHIKMLKEANMICQDENKSYILTDEGEKVLEGLKLFEKSF